MDRWETDSGAGVRTPPRIPPWKGEGQRPSNGDAQPPARPGRKPDSVYRVAIGLAILSLGNRAALEFNPVAQLPIIGRLADERYRGRSGEEDCCFEISSTTRSGTPSRPPTAMTWPSRCLRVWRS